jgi:RNA polymerase sigma-54 factor
MSLLSPRLQLKVAQKQILTPGLVQMVTVLQLNRLELKEMITQEIVKNPVLEESTEEAGEEITPEELMPLLEAEQEHNSDPADKQLLEASVLSDAIRWKGRPAMWPSTAIFSRTPRRLRRRPRWLSPRRPL